MSRDEIDLFNYNINRHKAKEKDIKEAI